MDGQAVGGEEDGEAEGDGHADDKQGVEQSQHYQNFTKRDLIKLKFKMLNLCKESHLHIQSMRPEHYDGENISYQTKDGNTRNQNTFNNQLQLGKHGESENKVFINDKF